MEGLTRFAKTSDKPSIKQVAMIMGIVTDELMEEIRETADDLVIAGYMSMMGRAMEWIATGDSEVLPEFLKPYAEQIEKPQAEIR